MRYNKIIHQACRQVTGFKALLYRLERNLCILGRSKATFENYARQVAAISLHYQCLPTDLNPEQVKDYLYSIQQRRKTVSQSFFKHTVYGLRFMLKTEGLSYDHLHLPVLKRDKKLPVILSKQEVWKMLKVARLLKHRILVGLLYGCGLRSMEVRNLRLMDFQFDRKQLHVVQGKGRKDRYVPLSEHMIRGLKTYIESEKPTDYLFNGRPCGRAGGDFDSRYSARGVRWIVKHIAKKAGINKDVHTHTLRHCYATHLLEDGVNIVMLKNLLGHERIETTMNYLHVCQLEHPKSFSPLDTLFAQCAPRQSTKMLNEEITSRIAEAPFAVSYY